MLFTSQVKTKELSYDCKRVRFEQSDLVMILLNLSYIPDEVIKYIDFMPGWQQRFKANMQVFKQNFEATYGRKWEFQDHNLEMEYSQYFHDKLREDPD